MKRLAFLLWAVLAATGWAEWQIEYDASFVELMRKVGRPISSRAGHYATEEECRAAIRRFEAGDASLVGKMRPVQVGGGGGQSTTSSSGHRPPAAPVRDFRKEEAEYQQMVARHQQLAAEVERQLVAQQAAFVAERDRLASSLKENSKPVLEFKDSPKRSASTLPALKQLEASAMLSILADQADLASNGTLARELSEISANMRLSLDETLRRKAPDAPAPTPVQQQFYEYVARESKAVAVTIQKTVQRLDQIVEKSQRTEQKVTELTAKLEQLKQPPATELKTADADKLLAEAQALLAQAESEKQKLGSELAALEATADAEYKKLAALEQAAATVTKQPERVEELLKQLQEARQ